MMRLRSLDHDAAGGIRYNRLKKSISQEIEQNKNVQKIRVTLYTEECKLKNSSKLLDHF